MTVEIGHERRDYTTEEEPNMLVEASIVQANSLKSDLRLHYDFWFDEGFIPKINQAGQCY